MLEERNKVETELMTKLEDLDEVTAAEIVASLTKIHETLTDFVRPTLLKEASNQVVITLSISKQYHLGAEAWAGRSIQYERHSEAYKQQIVDLRVQTY